MPGATLWAVERETIPPRRHREAKSQDSVALDLPDTICSKRKWIIHSALVRCRPPGGRVLAAGKMRRCGGSPAAPNCLAPMARDRRASIGRGTLSTCSCVRSTDDAIRPPGGGREAELCAECCSCGRTDYAVGYRFRKGKSSDGEGSRGTRDTQVPGRISRQPVLRGPRDL